MPGGCLKFWRGHHLYESAPLAALNLFWFNERAQYQPDDPEYGTPAADMSGLEAYAAYAADAGEKISALGGHVVVGDFVNVGWNAGVHQFCRLGKHCMVSACSKLVQDVPPYMLADGFPAEVRSINKIGMERNGFSSEDIEAARGVFKTIYKSDFNRSQAMLSLSDDSP
mgnify:CR=1 FL=1